MVQQYSSQKYTGLYLKYRKKKNKVYNTHDLLASFSAIFFSSRDLTTHRATFFDEIRTQRNFVTQHKVPVE